MSAVGQPNLANSFVTFGGNLPIGEMLVAKTPPSI
jgi:hypothetical protein